MLLILTVIKNMKIQLLIVAKHFCISQIFWSTSFLLFIVCGLNRGQIFSRLKQLVGGIERGSFKKEKTAGLDMNRRLLLRRERS